MAGKTVYRCKQDMVCAVAGQRRHFSVGELVLESHPVKPKSNPNFEEISEYVERISAPRHRGVVEEATAEPGRKRLLGGLLGPRVKEQAAEESGSERPPTSGAGSGVEAWRSYAVKVTDTPVESWAGLGRAEIIELLDSEGVTSDEPTAVKDAPKAQKEEVPDGQE